MMALFTFINMPYKKRLTNVVEIISEIIPDASPNSISEEILSILPQTEAQEAIAPLVKAKAPRNLSKSGHGFNKSKSEAKSPRSPKQPKS